MTTMTDELDLPDAPPIPGLRFRRLRDVDDYTALARLITAGSLADDLDFIPDPQSLQVEMEHEADFDPHRDLLLAEVDGRLIAYGKAGRTVRDGLAVYMAGGTSHPDWRRRGLGRAILRATEDHLRDRATAFEDPEGRVLGAWIGEKESGAGALLAGEGYTPVRYYFSMIRQELQEIPDAPLPDGIEIRPVEPDQHRAILDAENEAFRDHWGHREMTEEDFEGLFKLPDLDTSLWSVAWDGDEVAGSVQTFIWKAENEALGEKRGWLERISVRRPWRRRGLAKAIIADALRRLRAAGMEVAMLGVDADNPTGALQLYEALGFQTKDRGIAYRKAWQPGGRLV